MNWKILALAIFGVILFGLIYYFYNYKEEFANPLNAYIVKTDLFPINSDLINDYYVTGYSLIKSQQTNMIKQIGSYSNYWAFVNKEIRKTIDVTDVCSYWDSGDGPTNWAGTHQGCYHVPRGRGSSWPDVCDGKLNLYLNIFGFNADCCKYGGNECYTHAEREDTSKRWEGNYNSKELNHWIGDLIAVTPDAKRRYVYNNPYYKIDLTAQITNSFIVSELGTSNYGYDVVHKERGSTGNHADADGHHIPYTDYQIFANPPHFSDTDIANAKNELLHLMVYGTIDQAAHDDFVRCMHWGALFNFNSPELIDMAILVPYQSSLDGLDAYYSHNLFLPEITSTKDFNLVAQDGTRYQTNDGNWHDTSNNMGFNKKIIDSYNADTNTIYTPCRLDYQWIINGGGANITEYQNSIKAAAQSGNMALAIQLMNQGPPSANCPTPAPITNPTLQQQFVGQITPRMLSYMPNMLQRTITSFIYNRTHKVINFDKTTRQIQDALKVVEADINQLTADKNTEILDSVLAALAALFGEYITAIVFAGIVLGRDIPKINEDVHNLYVAIAAVNALVISRSGRIINQAYNASNNCVEFDNSAGALIKGKTYKQNAADFNDYVERYGHINIKGSLQNTTFVYQTYTYNNTYFNNITSGSMLLYSNMLVQDISQCRILAEADPQVGSWLYDKNGMFAYFMAGYLNSGGSYTSNTNNNWAYGTINRSYIGDSIPHPKNLDTYAGDPRWIFNETHYGPVISNDRAVYSQSGGGYWSNGSYLGYPFSAVGLTGTSSANDCLNAAKRFPAGCAYIADLTNSNLYIYLTKVTKQTANFSAKYFSQQYNMIPTINYSNVDADYYHNRISLGNNPPGTNTPAKILVNPDMTILDPKTLLLHYDGTNKYFVNFSADANPMGTYNCFDINQVPFWVRRHPYAVGWTWDGNYCRVFEDITGSNLMAYQESTTFASSYNTSTMNSMGPDSNAMLSNYIDIIFANKLLPDHGDKGFNPLDHPTLDQIAQTYYEYSKGTAEISIIYDVYQISSNMLDIRFDKKVHMNKIDYTTLRNSKIPQINEYNRLNDLINEGTWIKNYSSINDVQVDLSNALTQLDTVFNPPYAAGGGNMTNLISQIQANSTIMSNVNAQITALNTPLAKAGSADTSAITDAKQLLIANKITMRGLSNAASIGPHTTTSNTSYDKDGNPTGTNITIYYTVTSNMYAEGRSNYASTLTADTGLQYMISNAGPSFKELIATAEASGDTNMIVTLETILASTINADTILTNQIAGIETNVMRVFMHNNSISNEGKGNWSTIIDITGMALGSNAALTYNTNYNGYIEFPIDQATGNVNYQPVIMYTYNVTPPILCKDPAFIQRSAQLYMDAATNSLSSITNPPFAPSNGELRVDKVLGYSQIDDTTCGFTWEESQYDPTTNAPTTRTVNVVMPFFFDNSDYENPQVLINNGNINSNYPDTFEYLSPPVLNGTSNNNYYTITGNLCNAYAQMNKLLNPKLVENLGVTTTFSNVILSNIFYQAMKGTPPATSYIDKYTYYLQGTSCNVPITYIDQNVSVFSTAYSNYMSWYNTLSVPLRSQIHYNTVYSGFTQSSHLYAGYATSVGIPPNDATPEQTNGFVTLSNIIRANGWYAYMNIISNAFINKMFGSNIATDAKNQTIYTACANVSADIPHIVISTNPVATQCRILEPSEQKYLTLLPMIPASYIDNNIDMFTKYYNDIISYSNITKFESPYSNVFSGTPITIFRPPLEETVLDTADGACFPVNCETPAVMLQLLEQYNFDLSNNDRIVRILKGFTPNAYQCDYLVETVPETKENAIANCKYEQDTTENLISLFSGSNPKPYADLKITNQLDQSNFLFSYLATCASDQPNVIPDEYVNRNELIYNYYNLNSNPYFPGYNYIYFYKNSSNLMQYQKLLTVPPNYYREKAKILGNIISPRSWAPIGNPTPTRTLPIAITIDGVVYADNIDVMTTNKLIPLSVIQSNATDIVTLSNLIGRSNWSTYRKVITTAYSNINKNRPVDTIRIDNIDYVNNILGNKLWDDSFAILSNAFMQNMSNKPFNIYTLDGTDYVNLNTLNIPYSYITTNISDFTTTYTAYKTARNNYNSITNCAQYLVTTAKGLVLTTHRLTPRQTSNANKCLTSSNDILKYTAKLNDLCTGSNTTWKPYFTTISNVFMNVMTSNSNAFNAISVTSGGTTTEYINLANDPLHGMPVSYVTMNAQGFYKSYNTTIPILTTNPIQPSEITGITQQILTTPIIKNDPLYIAHHELPYQTNLQSIVSKTKKTFPVALRIEDCTYAYYSNVSSDGYFMLDSVGPVADTASDMSGFQYAKSALATYTDKVTSLMSPILDTASNAANSMYNAFAISRLNTFLYADALFNHNIPLSNAKTGNALLLNGALIQNVDLNNIIAQNPLLVKSVIDSYASVNSMMTNISNYYIVNSNTIAVLFEKANLVFSRNVIVTSNSSGVLNSNIVLSRTILNSSSAGANFTITNTKGYYDLVATFVKEVTPLNRSQVQFPSIPPIVVSQYTSNTRLPFNINPLSKKFIYTLANTYNDTPLFITGIVYTSDYYGFELRNTATSYDINSYYIGKYYKSIDRYVDDLMYNDIKKMTIAVAAQTAYNSFVNQNDSKEKEQLVNQFLTNAPTTYGKYYVKRITNGKWEYIYYTLNDIGNYIATKKQLQDQLDLANTLQSNTIPITAIAINTLKSGANAEMTAFMASLSNTNSNVISNTLNTIILGISSNYIPSYSNVFNNPMYATAKSSFVTLITASKNLFENSWQMTPLPPGSRYMGVTIRANNNNGDLLNPFYPGNGRDFTKKDGTTSQYYSNTVIPILMADTTKLQFGSMDFNYILYNKLSLNFPLLASNVNIVSLDNLYITKKLYDSLYSNWKPILDSIYTFYDKNNNPTMVLDKDNYTNMISRWSTLYNNNKFIYLLNNSGATYENLDYSTLKTISVYADKVVQLSNLLFVTNFNLLSNEYRTETLYYNEDSTIMIDSINNWISNTVIPILNKKSPSSANGKYYNGTTESTNIIRTSTYNSIYPQWSSIMPKVVNFPKSLNLTSSNILALTNLPNIMAYKNINNASCEYYVDVSGFVPFNKKVFTVTYYYDNSINQFGLYSIVPSVQETSFFASKLPNITQSVIDTIRNYYNTSHSDKLCKAYYCTLNTNTINIYFSSYTLDDYGVPIITYNQIHEINQSSSSNNTDALRVFNVSFINIPAGNLIIPTGANSVIVGNMDEIPPVPIPNGIVPLSYINKNIETYKTYYTSIHGTFSATVKATFTYSNNYNKAITNLPILFSPPNSNWSSYTYFLSNAFELARIENSTKTNLSKYTYNSIPKLTINNVNYLDFNRLTTNLDNNPLLSVFTPIYNPITSNSNIDFQPYMNQIRNSYNSNVYLGTYSDIVLNMFFTYTIDTDSSVTFGASIFYFLPNGNIDLQYTRSDITGNLAYFKAYFATDSGSNIYLTNYVQLNQSGISGSNLFDTEGHELLSREDYFQNYDMKFIFFKFVHVPYTHNEKDIAIGNILDSNYFTIDHITLYGNSNVKNTLYFGSNSPANNSVTIQLTSEQTPSFIDSFSFVSASRKQCPVLWRFYGSPDNINFALLHEQKVPFINDDYPSDNYQMPIFSFFKNDPVTLPQPFNRIDTIVHCPQSNFTNVYRITNIFGRFPYKYYDEILFLRSVDGYFLGAINNSVNYQVTVHSGEKFIVQKIFDSKSCSFTDNPYKILPYNGQSNRPSISSNTAGVASGVIFPYTYSNYINYIVTNIAKFATTDITMNNIYNMFPWTTSPASDNNPINLLNIVSFRFEDTNASNARLYDMMNAKLLNIEAAYSNNFSILLKAELAFSNAISNLSNAYSSNYIANLNLSNMHTTYDTLAFIAHSNLSNAEAAYKSSTLWPLQIALNNISNVETIYLKAKSDNANAYSIYSANTSELSVAGTAYTNANTQLKNHPNNQNYQDNVDNAYGRFLTAQANTQNALVIYRSTLAVFNALSNPEVSYSNTLSKYTKAKMSNTDIIIALQNAQAAYDRSNSYITRAQSIDDITYINISNALSNDISNFLYLSNVESTYSNALSNLIVAKSNFSNVHLTSQQYVTYNIVTNTSNNVLKFPLNLDTLTLDYTLSNVVLYTDTDLAHYVPINYNKAQILTNCGIFNAEDSYIYIDSNAMGSIFSNHFLSDARDKTYSTDIHDKLVALNANPYSKINTTADITSINYSFLYSKTDNTNFINYYIVKADYDYNFIYTTSSTDSLFSNALLSNAIPDEDTAALNDALITLNAAQTAYTNFMNTDPTATIFAQIATQETELFNAQAILNSEDPNNISNLQYQYDSVLSCTDDPIEDDPNCPTVKSDLNAAIAAHNAAYNRVQIATSRLSELNTQLSATYSSDIRAQLTSLYVEQTNAQSIYNNAVSYLNWYRLDDGCNGGTNEDGDTINLCENLEVELAEKLSTLTTINNQIQALKEQGSAPYYANYNPLNAALRAAQIAYSAAQSTLLPEQLAYSNALSNYTAEQSLHMTPGTLRRYLHIGVSFSNVILSKKSCDYDHNLTEVIYFETFGSTEPIAPFGYTNNSVLEMNIMDCSNSPNLNPQNQSYLQYITARNIYDDLGIQFERKYTILSNTLYTSLDAVDNKNFHYLLTLYLNDPVYNKLYSVASNSSSNYQKYLDYMYNNANNANITTNLIVQTILGGASAAIATAAALSNAKQNLLNTSNTYDEAEAKYQADLAIYTNYTGFGAEGTHYTRGDRPIEEDYVGNIREKIQDATSALADAQAAYDAVFAGNTIDNTVVSDAANLISTLKGQIADALSSKQDAQNLLNNWYLTSGISEADALQFTYDNPNNPNTDDYNAIIPQLLIATSNINNLQKQLIPAETNYQTLLNANSDITAIVNANPSIWITFMQKNQAYNEAIAVADSAAQVAENADAAATAATEAVYNNHYLATTSIFNYYSSLSNYNILNTTANNAALPAYNTNVNTFNTKYSLLNDPMSNLQINIQVLTDYLTQYPELTSFGYSIYTNASASLTTANQLLGYMQTIDTKANTILNYVQNTTIQSSNAQTVAQNALQAILNITTNAAHPIQTSITQLTTSSSALTTSKNSFIANPINLSNLDTSILITKIDILTTAIQDFQSTLYYIGSNSYVDTITELGYSLMDNAISAKTFAQTILDRMKEGKTNANNIVAAINANDSSAFDTYMNNLFNNIRDCDPNNTSECVVIDTLDLIDAVNNFNTHTLSAENAYNTDDTDTNAKAVIDFFATDAGTQFKNVIQNLNSSLRSVMDKTEDSYNVGKQIQINYQNVQIIKNKVIALEDIVRNQLLPAATPSPSLITITSQIGDAAAVANTDINVVNLRIAKETYINASNAFNTNTVDPILSDIATSNAAAAVTADVLARNAQARANRLGTYLKLLPIYIDKVNYDGSNVTLNIEYQLRLNVVDDNCTAIDATPSFTGTLTDDFSSYLTENPYNVSFVSYSNILTLNSNIVNENKCVIKAHDNVLLTKIFNMDGLNIVYSNIPTSPASNIMSALGSEPNHYINSNIGLCDIYLAPQPDPETYNYYVIFNIYSTNTYPAPGDPFIRTAVANLSLRMTRMSSNCVPTIGNLTYYDIMPISDIQEIPDLTNALVRKILDIKYTIPTSIDNLLITYINNYSYYLKDLFPPEAGMSNPAPIHASDIYTNNNNAYQTYDYVIQLYFSSTPILAHYRINILDVVNKIPKLRMTYIETFTTIPSQYINYIRLYTGSTLSAAYLPFIETIKANAGDIYSPIYETNPIQLVDIYYQNNLDEQDRNGVYNYMVNISVVGSNPNYVHFKLQTTELNSMSVDSNLIYDTTPTPNVYITRRNLNVAVYYKLSSIGNETIDGYTNILPYYMTKNNCPYPLNTDKYIINQLITYENYVMDNQEYFITSNDIKPIQKYMIQVENDTTLPYNYIINIPYQSDTYPVLYSIDLVDFDSNCIPSFKQTPLELQTELDNGTLDMGTYQNYISYMLNNRCSLPNGTNTQFIDIIKQHNYLNDLDLIYKYNYTITSINVYNDTTYSSKVDYHYSITINLSNHNYASPKTTVIASYKVYITDVDPATCLMSAEISYYSPLTTPYDTFYTTFIPTVSNCVINPYIIMNSIDAKPSSNDVSILNASIDDYSITGINTSMKLRHLTDTKNITDKIYYVKNDYANMKTSYIVMLTFEDTYKMGLVYTNTITDIQNCIPKITTSPMQPLGIGNLVTINNLITPTPAWESSFNVISNAFMKKMSNSAIDTITMTTVIYSNVQVSNVEYYSNIVVTNGISNNTVFSNVTTGRSNVSSNVISNVYLSNTNLNIKILSSYITDNLTNFTTYYNTITNANTELNYLSSNANVDIARNNMFNLYTGITTTDSNAIYSSYVNILQNAFKQYASGTKPYGSNNNVTLISNVEYINKPNTVSPVSLNYIANNLSNYNNYVSISNTTNLNILYNAYSSNYATFVQNAFQTYSSNTIKPYGQNNNVTVQNGIEYINIGAPTPIPLSYITSNLSAYNTYVGIITSNTNKIDSDNAAINNAIQNINRLITLPNLSNYKTTISNIFYNTMIGNPLSTVTYDNRSYILHNDFIIQIPASYITSNVAQFTYLYKYLSSSDIVVEYDNTDIEDYATSNGYSIVNIASITNSYNNNYQITESNLDDTTLSNIYNYFRDAVTNKVIDKIRDVTRFLEVSNSNAILYENNIVQFKVNSSNLIGALINNGSNTEAMPDTLDSLDDSYADETLPTTIHENGVSIYNNASLVNAMISSNLSYRNVILQYTQESNSLSNAQTAVLAFNTLSSNITFINNNINDSINIINDIISSNDPTVMLYIKYANIQNVVSNVNNNINTMINIVNTISSLGDTIINTDLSTINTTYSQTSSNYYISPYHITIVDTKIVSTNDYLTNMEIDYLVVANNYDYYNYRIENFSNATPPQLSNYAYNIRISLDSIESFDHLSYHISNTSNLDNILNLTQYGKDNQFPHAFDIGCVNKSSYQQSLSNKIIVQFSELLLFNKYSTNQLQLLDNSIYDTYNNLSELYDTEVTVDTTKYKQITNGIYKYLVMVNYGDLNNRFGLEIQTSLLYPSCDIAAVDISIVSLLIDYYGDNPPSITNTYLNQLTIDAWVSNNTSGGTNDTSGGADDTAGFRNYEEKHTGYVVKYVLIESKKPFNLHSIQLYDNNGILPVKITKKDNSLLLELKTGGEVVGYSFITNKNYYPEAWSIKGTKNGKDWIAMDKRKFTNLRPLYQMPLFFFDGQKKQLPQPQSRLEDKPEEKKIDRNILKKYYKQRINPSIVPNFKKKVHDSVNDVYYFLYDEYDLNKNLVSKDLVIGFVLEGEKIRKAIMYDDGDTMSGFDLKKKDHKRYWDSQVMFELAFE